MIFRKGIAFEQELNNMKKIHLQGKYKRALKVKNKIKSTAKRMRLSIFRSNTAIYGQIIDDAKRKTLVSATLKELKLDGKNKLTKSEKAKLLGSLIAQKSVNAKITEVVFDRNGYKFHGRIKSFAQGAREEGLKF